MKLLFINFTPENFRHESLAAVDWQIAETGSPLYNNPQAVPVHRCISPELSLLQLWPELREVLLSADVLVMHNGAAQLHLLDNALNRVGVTMSPLNYFCLQGKATQLLDLDYYDLETICSFYKIPPSSSTLEKLSALYELFNAVQPFAGLDMRIFFFSLDKLRGTYDEYLYDLDELEKLITNIRCDGAVQSEEFTRLKNWRVSRHEKTFALGYAPIMAILDDVLSDGILTLDECDDILNWLSTNKERHYLPMPGIWKALLAGIAPQALLESGDESALLIWLTNRDWPDNSNEQFRDRLHQLVQNGEISQDEGLEILDFLHNINIQAPNGPAGPLSGKTCVLTGNFHNGNRYQMEKLVTAAGGVVSHTVNRFTDILLVGGDDRLLTDRRTGRQLNRARELQEQGIPLEIMSENKLWPPKRLSIWRRGGQNCIMLLILLNLISAMLETSPTMAARFAGFFSFFNIFSTIVFIVEMVVRIILDGKKFWVGRRSAWNYFDLSITIATSLTFNSAISSIRLLRMARMLRVMRALRIFSGLKNLRNIMGALLRSLPKIGWTFLLMVIVFLIWATIGTNLFGGPNGAEPFADIGRSLFTLVQLMTFDDLGNIAIPLIAANAWAVIYFLSFIFIISFVMLNVLTGVIVDSVSNFSEDIEDNE